jgi:hypothetical protein
LMPSIVAKPVRLRPIFRAWKGESDLE